MIKHHKKSILVPVNEPSFYRHAANGEHNEVTVIVAHYAIPVNTMFGGVRNLNPVIVEKVNRAMESFQVDFDFNGNMSTTAFTFTVKAKTERRGNDVHNQELADRIVTAKANAKACVVANKVVDTIIEHLLEFRRELADIGCTLSKHIARELEYVHKI